MAYAGGVDVGSTQTKAVIINEKLEIVGRSLTDTGSNVTVAAENAFNEAIKNADIHEEEEGVEFIVGTGYGRYKVTFGDAQTTEISCHGRGAVHMFPGTRTVVDMGGQDTKAIRVAETGEILDFVMNDKCAAGTGRFLGAAASALGVPLGELGGVALKSSRPVKISTTCTVFADGEILSLIGKGKKVEDVLLGVHQSVVSRALSLMRRVGIEKEVTFTGGVANNIGMVTVLNQELGFDCNVSSDSHYMGALGAALFAMDRIMAGRKGQHGMAEVK
ncbi:MAG: acyl-CoA dehydratase activase [Actinomycetota bacterium]|jgi:predicted CoA-substrate-specific enzyme activase|nr:acyl-CoA dehydratase activase [Actinomycetota bacterium]